MRIFVSAGAVLLVTVVFGYLGMALKGNTWLLQDTFENGMLFGMLIIISLVSLGNGIWVTIGEKNGKK